MIAVIQRVTQSSVSVEGLLIATIGPGLLVLLGVARGDTDSDVRFMVEKIPQLRIFADTQGHMNHSLHVSIGGSAIGYFGIHQLLRSDELMHVKLMLQRKSTKRSPQ